MILSGSEEGKTKLLETKKKANNLGYILIEEEINKDLKVIKLPPDIQIESMLADLDRLDHEVNDRSIRQSL